MTTIERQVMASVGTIYAVRQLFSMTALKLYICVASVWGLGQLVWVAKIFENLPEGGVVALLQFTLAAALNTDAAVQLVLVVGILAFASLLVDLARTPTRRFA